VNVAITAKEEARGVVVDVKQIGANRVTAVIITYHTSPDVERGSTVSGSIMACNNETILQLSRYT